MFLVSGESLARPSQFFRVASILMYAVNFLLASAVFVYAVGWLPSHELSGVFSVIPLVAGLWLIQQVIRTRIARGSWGEVMICIVVFWLSTAVPAAAIFYCTAESTVSPRTYYMLDFEKCSWFFCGTIFISLLPASVILKYA